MYSEKLENIPKNKSQAFRTYLSNAYSAENSQVTRRQLAKESDLDEPTVQTILSELTTSNVIVAKLCVRCPYCNTQHGIFAQRSAVPNDEKRCFSCENNFRMDKQRNWEVIYEISDDPEDFFQNENLHIEYYVNEERELPASFFVRELENFKENYDGNEQQRGREFDKFVGLLFQQLPGVEIRLKSSGDAGEIDVHMHCLEAPDWLYRLVGSQTRIENKWEAKPTETSEISTFREKTTELSACNVAYFVSMGGFSRGKRKQTGALAQLKSYRDPRMVDLWDDDLEKMVEDGTPKNVIKNRSP